EHEEDSWIGSRVEVGGARIRVTGPVGRCVVTTRNPDSGESDLDTLGVLAGYRTLREGKSFGCGVCGDVLDEWRIRIGDSLVRGNGREGAASAAFEPIPVSELSVSPEGSRHMRQAFQKVVEGMLKSFRSVFHSDKAED